ncbi:MAG: cytochrome c3 family protein [Candidatus Rokubacteria bacterium]|nr:cytochrome c3 family protein [Candidatus Rokubacteria bacterium]
MSGRALLPVLVALALVAGGAHVTAPARAQQPATPPSGLQHPGLRPPLPEETKPHRTGELDCRGCHQGKHQGVLSMYLGLGGRGTPMIPSHMFQVRVECVACHIAPKEAEKATAGLVGQTFRPSEQACLGCHGDRYQGMLDRWSTTLTGMTTIVAPKVAAARAALTVADPKHPRLARARRLADDAEANLRFVTFGKGVHNVFYAADLLKLANGWADETMTLLGKPPAKSDDTLVRGGYCAVLCHEQANVKQSFTVEFGKLRVPHVRHVTEFGATCTSCHSPEIHKKVTATAATCSSCHHGPQSERCESCHRAQSAFYRGKTQTPLAKVEPNLMADAVGCTGCHDWSSKPSRAAIREKCLGCHDAPYLALLTEWTAGFGADLKKAAEAVRRAEAAIARARRDGHKTPEADALLKRAREALALVRKGGAAHNPLAADALLSATQDTAAQAAARAH